MDIASYLRIHSLTVAALNRLNRAARVSDRFYPRTLLTYWFLEAGG